MNVPFKKGAVLAPGPRSPVNLKARRRVLDWDIEANAILLVDMPALGEGEGKENQMRAYAPTPKTLVLDDIIDQALEFVLVEEEEKKNEVSDEDRLQQAESDAEREQLNRYFAIRNARQATVDEVVCEPPVTVEGDVPGCAGKENETEKDKQQRPLRRPLDVLSDPNLRNLLARAAARHGVGVKTVERWVHRFWAGDSKTSSLMPGYGRCGNPGVEKPQRVGLGRKHDATREGCGTREPFPLTRLVKRQLAFGYDLIKRDTPPRTAYLITMSVFFAKHWTDEKTGKRQFELCPEDQRPSFDQFMYWGQKLTEMMVADMVMPAHERRARRTRGRVEQARVAALGVMSYFDATSTDVYLTRVYDRLRSLPAMTRSLLIEAKSTVIYGVYFGWDAPSPATALLTILNGADPDKIAKWNKEFRLEIPEGAMPWLLCKESTVDNGEMKAKVITQAEQQFRFSLRFTPPFSGRSKGPMESVHHADHAHFDHQIPGSTLGKMASRGNPSPIGNALWNRREYVPEALKRIVEYNCFEEVPDLVPPEMEIAAPDVKPTRINIFNWLRANDYDQSLTYDYESLRAFCLPDHPAVIRKNGVRLLVKMSGREVVLPRFTYWSEELADTGIFAKVRSTGKPIRVKVKIDPEHPGVVWLAFQGKMFELSGRAQDGLYHRDFTLTEFIDLMSDLRIGRLLRTGERDQHDAEEVMRRRDITANAKAERNAQIKAAGKRPSIATQKGTLTQNLEDELAAMADEVREAGEPTVSNSSEALEAALASLTGGANEVTSDEPLSAAEEAMAAYRARAGAPA